MSSGGTASGPEDDLRGASELDPTVEMQPQPMDMDGLSGLLADLHRREHGWHSEGPPTFDSQTTASFLRDALRLMERSWPDPIGDLTGGTHRIGRYELLAERGRGGFGIVYRAYDPQLHRVVALKIPRLEGLALPELRQRFLDEIRAATRLRHPNIVPVFDSGQEGVFCYLAGFFVEGPTLLAWLTTRGAPVPPREAAELVAALADAVEHAHERGVLHLDLKPGNILLRPRVADAPLPLITDFGLARFLGELVSESSHAAPIGTPEYMSPEQAAGRADQIGKAADLYGLGAILYEVLTGRPPHRGETAEGTLRLVRTEPPIPPRDLRPGLPKDLETICLQCLDKAPDRRYASAADLADDLRRFLHDEPIKARAPSTLERLRVWSHRRPGRAVAAVASLAIVALIVLGLAIRVSVLREHREALEGHLALVEASEDEANRQRLMALRHFNASQMNQASEALIDGEVERAQEILDDLGPRVGGRGQRGGFAWRMLRDRAYREIVPLRGHRRSVVQVDVAPGHGAIASADLEERLLLWDPEGRGPSRELAGPGWGASYPRFSPDGRYLAAFETEPGGGDRRRGLALWDASGALLARIVPEPGIVHFHAIHFPDRDLLGLSWERGDGTIAVGVWSLDDDPSDPCLVSTIAGLHQVAASGGLIVDLHSDRLALFEAAGGASKARLDIEGGGAWCLDLAPDAQAALIHAPEGGPALLIDLNTGAEVARAAIPGRPTATRFGPRGRTAAIADETGLVTLLSLEGWTRTIRSDPRVRSMSVPLAFSSDGTRIALAPWSRIDGPGLLSVWTVADGVRRATFPGLPRQVAQMAFGPEDRWLALGAGPTLWRWRLEPEPEVPQPSGHGDEAWPVAFHPSLGIFATGSDDTLEDLTLKLWDAETAALIRGWKPHEATTAALDFHPRGRLIATAGLIEVGNLRLWDAESGALVADLVGHTDKVRAVVFSPDGRWLASAGSDRTIRVWDLDDPGSPCVRVLRGHGETVNSLAFHPDGLTLASAGNDATVRFWDLQTGACRIVLDDAEKYPEVRFSPDGRIAAAADEYGSVTLFETRNGTVLRVLRSHARKILAMAFTPDGLQLAIAGVGAHVCIWDVATGQRLLSLPTREAQQINDLAFSLDGDALVACGHGGAVQVWRASNGGRQAVTPAPSRSAPTIAGSESGPGRDSY